MSEQKKDRRLIEDSLPLAAISTQSAREKYIRDGHISTLHLWWARRPLAACRAAVYASLVDAPTSEEDRTRQHELLTKLVDWDVLDPKHRDHHVIADAVAEIQRCHARRTGHAGAAPRLIDPFSGGGAIPLEAERLGCQTIANDLNPVAHVIELGSVRYPQLFANDLVRVEPAASLPGIPVGVPTPRLARDVARWGVWVREQVEVELSDLYPASAKDREVLGYFWVRQALCSNPGCRALIPVVNQTWLANKPGRKIAYQIVPKADRKSVEYRIYQDDDGEFDFDPKAGTYGDNRLVCPCCGQVTDGDYLRAEGMAGRLREELALVCEVSTVRQGRFYRLATDADRAAVDRAKALAASVSPIEGDVSPDRPSSNARGLSAVTRYGMTKFAHFFNARQTVTLDRFANKVQEVYLKVREEGEPEEYARAVATYLGLALDRVANQCSRLSRWDNTGEKIQGVYSKQAVAMIWDYIESNPIGSKTASWDGAVEWGTAVIRKNAFPNPAQVFLGSATDLASRGIRVDLVVSDPPYYDSVPYSDISDFFYVWLRRTVGVLYPEAFDTPLTPKRREIIQHNPRHGGEQKARSFYEKEMTRAFAEMAKITEDDGIIVIVFAHKSTAAWETLLNSLLSSGLVVTASWPIDTEMSARTSAQGAASLASSVFIVCRKRTAHDDGFFDDVEPELVTRLHERLDYFWSQGIRGADFFMSAIGPAVEVFGRHARVLTMEGTPVTVGALLDRVRGIVADYALKRIVHGAEAGRVDEASRFYVLWRWAFGTADVESGEAIHMAQSMGCEFNALIGDRGVLEKKGDKVKLRGPFERAKVRGLGQQTAERGYAPLVDVLHRAANLWAEGDRQGLADFLTKSLPGADTEPLQRLGQSVVDVLPPADKERALYENFLVGARALPKPGEPGAPSPTQQNLFKKA